MPCMVVVVALLVPRVAMFFIWVLTTWFPRSFETWYWPLLGFFFLPYTTLAYMAAMLNNAHGVTGWWLVLLVAALIVDLGHADMGRRRRRP